MSDEYDSGASVHALTGAYVVDALDDEERARFREHLPHCSDCRAEVRSLRRTATILAEDAAVTPPARLRESVLGAIREVRPLPPGSAGGDVASLREHRERRERRRLALLAASVAAVFGVGLGAAWHPWTADERPATTVTAMDRVLGAPDAAHASVVVQGGGVITVVRSDSEGRGVAVTRDLPAAPPGRAYEFWLRGTGGQLVPAGLVTGSGAQKLMLRGDTRQARAFAVTIEPARGSKHPTTAPIGYADLPKASA